MRLNEIEDAAVEFVVAKEAEESRQAKDVRVPFRGYHVEARGKEEGDECFVVVKGLEGLWGDRGVVLTKQEFESALLHAEKTWLYVVEFAGQSSAKLLRVHDPASLVDQFVFDRGWVSVAEGDGTDPPEPVVGTRIRLDDGRTVVINTIDKDGEFTVVNDGEGENEWVGPMRVLQSMVVEEG